MFIPCISRFSFVDTLNANQVSCAYRQHYTAVICAHAYTSARLSILRKINSLRPPQVSMLFRSHPRDLDLHHNFLKGAQSGVFIVRIFPETSTASSRSSAQKYARLQCHLSLKITCMSGDLVIST